MHGSDTSLDHCNCNPPSPPGGPGSGKGTQCAKIVKEFGFKHISAGDLLRQEVAKETDQGKEIQQIMTQGKLVPAEVIVKLLKQTLLTNSNVVGFLLDGFPRNLSQGEAFEREVCMQCMTS